MCKMKNGVLETIGLSVILLLLGYLSTIGKTIDTKKQNYFMFWSILLSVFIQLRSGQSDLFK